MWCEKCQFHYYVFNLRHVKDFFFHKSSNKQEQLTRNVHSENKAGVTQTHFRTQIIARQPISDNQVAACVFEAYDFAYHPQSAPSSRTSNTPSVLQTLQSSLSRGTKHLARSFIFLSGVPPQHCTSLICTHIKYCIGILFFQYLLFYFQTRPPLKDRAAFLHTNFIR